MSEIVVIADYEVALFNGDRQVTDWVRSGNSVPGPGVTVTELRCRFPGGEIRQSFTGLAASVIDGPFAVGVVEEETS